MTYLQNKIHVRHDIISVPNFVNVEVSKSFSSESVYVIYTNEKNGKVAKVRFSTHKSNASKFGDVINSFNPDVKNEILYRLGLIGRKFVPEMRLQINVISVSYKKAKNYKEAELTLKEMYELGENADLSDYVEKLAKGSNQIIKSKIIKKVPLTKINALGEITQIGKYIYGNNINI